jgi:hypothetical protein
MEKLGGETIRNVLLKHRIVRMVDCVGTGDEILLQLSVEGQLF